ncbi:unnamed protein product [Microthlaspi erraticum]|uniref:Arabidopsis retrotransposon Orf1 C-terminal domain-containing protein n=1 Tax=Microthlaspi erraticum TaxID=1685480 RepID=A0A6D2KJU7_9BRAS|nr:unnamed protein product [Microthlaspi erraticum]
MVTFRQLEILFGFTYGEGKWNIKENELQGVWATIADGVYSSSRSKAAQIRSPVLRYVHKALANTFFARKATGTINEGEVKLLDMGIKPIISRTRNGKKIRGDRAHAGNLMPLLEQLQAYKVTAYNTRHQRGRKLSVGGVITPILCAAGVQVDKRRRDNTQRRRKTSKARRSSSTTGLDRVQTEETQLDRAEGRVDLEEPLFENPGFEYDPTQYQDFSRPLDPYNSFEQASSTKAKGATHTFDEEEEEEEPQARSSEATQLSGVLLMAVSHLQTTT